MQHRVDFLSAIYTISRRRCSALEFLCFLYDEKNHENNALFSER